MIYLKIIVDCVLLSVLFMYLYLIPIMLNTMKTQTVGKEDNRAKNQAQYGVDDICEMMSRHEEANKKDNMDLIDEIQTEIRESSYGVNVTKQYEITISGGGPATRIIGELGEYNEPQTANMQYQDWWTPWTDLSTSMEQDDALLEFAQQFYFGE